MPKLLLGVWLLLALSLLSAAEVTSVVSRDASKEVNNISVGLSGEASYRVESSADGKTHRLVIKDAANTVERPDWQRLSPVIDRLSVNREGTGTVIEIKTMKPSRIIHSATGASISLQLNQGSAPAPEPKAPVVKAQPERASRPETERLIPKEPKPKPEPEAEPAQPVHSDSSELEIAPPPAAEAAEPEPPQAPVENEVLSFLRVHWQWMSLLAVGLLLLIWSIRACVRSRRLRALTEPEPEEVPALIMDTATRQRMVMRLVEQGWTAPQVAAELRVPLKEVKRLIATAKKHPEL